MPKLLNVSWEVALGVLFSGEEGHALEFGANQCVLVMSEAERVRLRKEFPTSLVLTVEQSKGLEFHDILVCNFFDSNAGSTKKGVALWHPD